MLLEILDQHVPHAEVWAYGSRVNGTGHEGSDLDLVLRNCGGAEVPFRQLSALRCGFSDSNLPILVDILDWARIPESFRREIEREHTVIKPLAVGNISGE